MFQEAFARRHTVGGVKDAVINSQQYDDDDGETFSRANIEKPDNTTV